ncbi:MAG TPA: YHS domain-containing (seleno)protein [Ignavibacteria bacterium]|nr:YHS domain-containing (seleno)protein [Ignavibacteria bacterium]
MRSKKLLNRISAILGIIVLILIAFAFYNHIFPLSWGLHGKVNKGIVSGEAIHGYDPVAYFTELKAVKGNSNFSFGYNNATWYFTSQENLDLFKSDPDKYLPQYGGYCSFAVSKGFSADSDPETFDIIDGKLYLCAEPDIKNEWLKEGKAGIEKANENWK